MVEAVSYVVSRSGTFGVAVRTYLTSHEQVPMVLIRWGILGWLTPVAVADVRWLSSAFESEARAEAERWIKAQGP